jgi:hypothetical protein
MAGSSFGSLHAGMLLRAETEGETPAANKQSNRPSLGVLQSITPEQHLLHPETRATGGRSGPEFETGVKHQAFGEPRRPAPFDRGFGHRVDSETNTANGQMVPDVTPPAPPVVAIPVETNTLQLVETTDEILPPAPVHEAEPEPAKVPAWRRSMFGGGQRKQGTEAGSTGELPSSTSQSPPTTPEHSVALIEKVTEVEVTAEPAAETRPEPAPEEIQQLLPPPSSDEDKTPAEAAPKPIADTVAEAPQPLLRVPPSEVPPPIEQANEKQPKPELINRSPTAKKRKKLTVRLKMTNFQRLVVACASLELTRQDILANALDKYLDHLGIAKPDDDSDQDETNHE